MNEKPGVLFLCTGNSCRSQMAHGFCRHYHQDRYRAFSAGIETHGLNPMAVRVMAESGVDISSHESKKVEDLPENSFDYVITVCGHAAETCPFFPARVKVLHRGFDDPPRLAEDLTSEEDILDVYRRVRDEIDSFVRELPRHLQG